MKHPRSIRIVSALALILLLFSGLPAPARAQETAPSGEYALLLAKAEEQGTVRVIVKLDIGKPFTPEGDLSPEGVKAQRLAIAKAQNDFRESLSEQTVTYHAIFKYIPYVALETDAEALTEINGLSIVRGIQEDVPIPAALASSTPIIGAPVVWDAGYTGSGWAVAVLDTGVQWDHPFLGGSAASRVVSEACYSTTDAVAQTLCPNGLDVQETGHASDPTTANCLNGGSNICTHGTHVAGIAAGDGASYDGVAPGANVIGIQVFSRFNSDVQCGTGLSPCVLTYTSDQMLGLQRVYDLSGSYNIASVNMSLGGGNNTTYCDSDARKAYIDNLLSVGIATVIATGNNGYTTGISAPSCISTAVAVGATNDADTVASFSNSNSLVDLLAPGVAIDSSVPPSAYANYQGTSMATPHVAGAWALIKSAIPSATPAQILAALQSQGVSVTDTRNGVTKPRIQVDAAAASLKPAMTWLGNTTVWNTASNWSPSATPDSISTVLIPASPSGGNFPALDASSSVYDLTVQSSAAVSMTGGTFNVYGDFTVQAGGKFDGTGGTTVFQGAMDQAVTMPDDAHNQFYHLQIGDGASSHTVSPGSALDIDGDITIAAGAAFQPGSNTISVAGNWTDAESAFIPGTSTVIFNGGGQTAQITSAAVALLQETFSAYDGLAFSSYTYSGPAGWSVENTSGGDYPWFFTGWDRNPNVALNGHARHYRSTNTTTWLFTPALTLYNGVTYQLDFKYGVYSGTRSVRVGIGASATSAGMTTILRDFNASNTTWNTDSSAFTVPADGTYYIGFRAETSTAGDGLSLDDISVSALPKLIFYNLTVDAAAAGATLGDETLVQNNLTVNSGGHLALGASTLAVNGAVTNNGSISQSKTVPGGSTTEFLHILNSAGDTSKYYGVDITPGSAMGATTVIIEGNQAACTSVPADPLLRRCFEINPGAAVSATVRFWFTEAERNGQAANALKLWHYNGPSSWTQVGSGYTYSESGTDCLSGGGAACWFQAQNVSTYSPFGVGSGGTPTAIRLEGLSAAPGASPLPLGMLALAACAGLWVVTRRRRK